MKFPAILLAIASLSIFSTTARAQSSGRVECARSDGYIYLYSSMTTLDVRTTLQCGEIVRITGNYEFYYGARTAKGEIGYIPIGNITLLKDEAGPAAPQPAAAPPARERTPYDERAVAPPAPVSSVPDFALLKDTPIRVKLLQNLSSATAHTGDPVEFEVLEDVLVKGVLVVSRGSKATGAVAEVEIKKRFGHDGKVSFNINSVLLTNNETAPVRCYFSSIGSSNATASAKPLASGKDAAIAQGTEFTARIDGNVPLKRESFPTNRNASSGVPASQNPKSQR
jgi:hypothetical protein